MKRYIPHVFTLLNLLLGSIASVFAAKGQLETAALLVFAGIVCDFLDGLLARALKVQSELGVQLDSLADMVTCGLVPGIALFQLLSWATEYASFSDGYGWSDISGGSWLPWIGFIVTLSSAYRLAKFNIDEDQAYFFKGLPTPANALLILSFPLILKFQGNDMMNSTILNPWFLVGVSIVSAYLLQAPIQLFALKFKDWRFARNATKYLFIMLSILLLVVLRFAAIPLVIVLYVLMSVAATYTDGGKKSSGG
jgi:CDP-diacylglycerol--serine O-phosphatidyltransferase